MRIIENSFIENSSEFARQVLCSNNIFKNQKRTNSSRHGKILNHGYVFEN